MYSNSVSFRLGIDGLTNIITSNFEENELEGNLYVFFSKDRKQIKIMEYDERGSWLYQNKLYEGRFVMPSILEDGTMQIDKKQLKMIIENLEIIGRKVKSKQKMLLTFFSVEKWTKFVDNLCLFSQELWAFFSIINIDRKDKNEVKN